MRMVALVGWAMVAMASVSAAPAMASGACMEGAYGDGQGDIVVLGAPAAAPAAEQRYLFLDGRRGAIGAADGPVTCSGDKVSITTSDGSLKRLPRIALKATPAKFNSAGTELSGQLLEPAGAIDPERPLVVLVHGSERTMAVSNIYGPMLAAQGISIFSYHKRGTGESEGEYTQNFELLADDAAAALRQARKMAAGRFGRAGFFGGSQGGWVAPLAATGLRRLPPRAPRRILSR